MKNKLFLKIVLILLFANIFLLQNIKAQQDTSGTVNFYDLSFEELMKIEVISAGKTKEKAGTVPASVVILTREEIESYGFKTLTEVIEHVSGFYNIDDYIKNTGKFGVRGFFAEEGDNPNIAILVNNIPQIFNKLFVPIQAIDRIEIVRGPLSVIYGSGSMFGAINIITNEIGDINKNLLSFSYGSMNSYNVFGRSTGKIDDFKYSFNVCFDKSDGRDVQYSDLMRETDFIAFQQMEKHFGVDYPANTISKKQYETNNLYFNFNGNFHKFNVNLLFNQNTYERFFMYPSIKDGTRSANLNSGITVGWQNKFTDKISLNVRINYNFLYLKQNYDVLSINFYGNDLLTQNNLDAEINNVINPIKNLTIVTGLNYSSYFNYANFLNVPSAGDSSIINSFNEYKPNNHNDLISFFTQGIYDLLDNKLKIIAGLRLEQNNSYTQINTSNNATANADTTYLIFEKQNPVFIPRFGVVYSINKNNIAKLLYGAATKREKYVGVIPEKVQTFEFNYLFTSSIFSSGLNIFLNSFKDLVLSEYYYNQSTQTYTEKYSNSGKMETIGSELTLSVHPIRNLMFELGLTYQETKDKNNVDIKNTYSPNFLGQFKASYIFKKFVFGITGYYVDAMETYWVAKNPITGVDAQRLGDKVDSYYLLGANLKINDIYKGLYFNIRCSNLLDTKFRYPTTHLDAQLTKGTIGDGRFILGTVGLKF